MAARHKGGGMVADWQGQTEKDIEKLRGFDNRQTDGQTDGRTFTILELLSRLKNVLAVKFII